MYWYVEHPTNSKLQLADDDGQMLVFTSEELAQARIEKFGHGGKIVGPKSVHELVSAGFGYCRKIVLIDGTSEKAMNICGLSA